MLKTEITVEQNLEDYLHRINSFKEKIVSSFWLQNRKNTKSKVIFAEMSKPWVKLQTCDNGSELEDCGKVSHNYLLSSWYATFPI